MNSVEAMIGFIVLFAVSLGLITLLIDSLLDIPLGILKAVLGFIFLILLLMPFLIVLAITLERFLS